MSFINTPPPVPDPLIVLLILFFISSLWFIILPPSGLFYDVPSYKSLTPNFFSRALTLSILADNYSWLRFEFVFSCSTYYFMSSLNFLSSSTSSSFFLQMSCQCFLVSSSFLIFVLRDLFSRRIFYSSSFRGAFSTSILLSIIESSYLDLFWYLSLSLA